jgi:hypothetical protein
MREIARDHQFEARFDALVVDEAQDHDTSWPGLESDKTGSGWWEIYWKLLREQTDARMAIFCDADQRPLFRQRERFEAARVFEGLSQPAHVNLLFTLRYSLPIFPISQDTAIGRNNGLGQESSVSDRLARRTGRRAP